MSSTALSKALNLLDAGVVLLSRIGLSENFIRFGIVGTLGFCWDTSTVYALRPFVNLYIAATCGFFVAATANWGANRIWTYRHQQHAPPHVQWAKFMAANAIGFICNRGVLFVLISKFFQNATKIHIFYTQPVIAIATGSIAGLCFNYFLSKRLVFR